MTYNPPISRYQRETHAICYAHGDEVRILQWDHEAAASRNCATVNNHEAANGRPRKFWVEERK